MPYRKRYDKKEDVESFLEYQYSEYGFTHFTLRELAINLGYRPSTKFNQLVWDMVDEGRVRLQWVDHINGSACPRKSFVCLPENYEDQLSFWRVE